MLSPNELRALWQAAHSDRDQALLAVPLDTGARLGEIASIIRPSLGPDYIYVTGKEGTRRLQASREVIQMLQAIGDERHVWLGQRGPLTIHGIQGVYQRLFDRAGITRRKTSGPHILRHTFATNYLDSQGNIRVLQQLMGHSSLRTTSRYLHLSSQGIVQDHAAHSPFRTIIEAARAPG